MSQSIYYSLKNVPSKFKKLRSFIKTDKINYFSFYPEVIHMLDTNLEKINWHNLLRNPEAIHQLQTNLNKIDWEYLSMNPNAIHILEANFDKINWCFLSKNPAAIHLLEANQDKIDWNSLSENSEAIHLLEANIDKINWYLLSKNPAIFELDYNAISSSIEVFKEELIQTVYHPYKVERMLIEYNYCLADDNYI